MAGLKWYGSITYTLSAGQERLIAIAGTQIACLAATAEFHIAVDDSSFSPLNAGLTRTLEAGQSFQVVRVRNVSGGNNTITLQIGWGDLRDSRLTVSGVVNVSKAAGQAAQPDVSVAAGGYVTVVAASTTRRRAYITNLSTVIAVRVGGGDGTALNVPAGNLLGPGETIRFETTAAINVYNPGGAAVSIGSTVDQD